MCVDETVCQWLFYYEVPSNFDLLKLLITPDYVISPRNCN